MFAGLSGDVRWAAQDVLSPRLSLARREGGLPVVVRKGEGFTCQLRYTVQRNSLRAFATSRLGVSGLANSQTVTSIDCWNEDHESQF